MLGLVALGNEIDGKPVGDEVPDGVGEGLRKDDAPGLGEAEESGIRERRGAGRGGVGAIFEDVGTFSGGEAGVGFGRMVEPAEEGNPEQTEAAGEEEGGPPIVEKVIDGVDEQWGDGTADGGAGIVDRDGPTGFAAREPFGDGFSGSGPVGGFAGTEEETAGGEAGEARRERGGHGGEAVESDGEGEAAAEADAIKETAGEGLAERVGDAERDDEEGEGGVVPVELGFDVGGEDGEGLAVDVVDDCGEEKGGDDVPAEVGDGRGHVLV